MNLELPEIAIDFGAAAERAFTDAGGVDLARRAEEQPVTRVEVVAPLLDLLGALDLHVADDLDTALAGGELCRVAGRCALPYPVTAVLASGSPDRPPAALIDPVLPRTDHGDLLPRWRLAAIDGGVWEGRPEGSPLGTELGPFVVDMATSTTGDPEPVDVAMLLTLTAWQTLGTLERALELAVEHVTTRHQFGGPLAQFQAVQFQIADATVAVQSLRELAHFTLWRLWAAPLDRLVDAMVLRTHALESAHAVLRTCHQLHGAIGFCDEHDLSIVSRHAQPLLRLSAGLEATTEQLMAAIDDTGFDSLFDAGATTRAAHNG
ncbi:MAG TPA: acyl-CoA dehydrogenase family protein [Acidimicrobiales bacterium]